ncbi:MAG: csbC [Frankiales bacterium]|nr:csbC [Frankiales bacterium]
MTITEIAASPAAVLPPSRRRHEAGFWSIGAAFLVVMAFSAVPTPLYVLYQARDGFSTFTVTVIFAAYAVGVVAGLVLLGHVSDWVGRKTILIPALVLSLVSAAIFLVWPALPGLLVARLVNGVAVGMFTATATAHLHELHSTAKPATGPKRFEIVSTAVNLGGIGTGPLIAGALAQFVTAPLRTPYLVFAVLLALSIVAVAVTPETVGERAVRPAYRPQRINADLGDRAGYFAAVGAGFAAFAIFGVFTSLAPGFVGGTLHHPGRLLAGAVAFMVFGIAAVAQATTANLSTSLRSGLGIVGEAVGLVVLAIGLQQGNLATFLVGGAVAGAGAGLLFKAAVGAVVAMAAPEVRGEALAGLFLSSYFGLVLSAIGLGVATLYTSTATAMMTFVAVLLLLLAAVAVLGRRREPTAEPG